jgi:hypothetical protein
MQTRISDARDSPVNEAGFANAGKSGQCRLKRLFFNLEPTAIDLPRSMPPSWRSVAGLAR